MVARAVVFAGLVGLLAAAPGLAHDRLTMDQAHTLVAGDLDRHFHALVRVQVWGCKRRSAKSIGCFTEFDRHRPQAVCVVHYEVARHRGNLVLAFRKLEPLFGSPCRRAAHGVAPHYHLR